MLSVFGAAVRWPFAGMLRRRRERRAEAQRQARIEAWQLGQLKARLAFCGDDYRRVVRNGECVLPLYTFDRPSSSSLVTSSRPAGSC